MNKRARYLLGAAAGATGLAGVAEASDTTSYTYDALGRLVAVSTSGGPNDGLGVGTCYDPAGNRSTYAVATGTPPPACAAPPPPPSNQPPTTVADSISVARCASGTRNVLANDSDPEGNLPLALVGVTQGTKGAAAIVSPTTIEYTAGPATGADTVTYTVQDSLGATSNGIFNVTITGGSCD